MRSNSFLKRLAAIILSFALAFGGMPVTAFATALTAGDIIVTVDTNNDIDLEDGYKAEEAIFDITVENAGDEAGTVTLTIVEDSNTDGAFSLKDASDLNVVAKDENNGVNDDAKLVFAPGKLHTGGTDSTGVYTVTLNAAYGGVTEENTTVVTVTVTQPQYAATLDTTDGDFGKVKVGDYASEELTFTITNIGSEELVDLNAVFGLTDGTSFEVDGTFEDADITSGNTSTITIKPKTGLTVDGGDGSDGLYEDTLTIKDAAQNVELVIDLSVQVVDYTPDVVELSVEDDGELGYDLYDPDPAVKKAISITNGLDDNITITSIDIVEDDTDSDNTGVGVGILAITPAINAGTNDGVTSGATNKAFSVGIDEAAIATLEDGVYDANVVVTYNIEDGATDQEEEYLVTLTVSDNVPAGEVTVVVADSSDIQYTLGELAPEAKEITIASTYENSAVTITDIAIVDDADGDAGDVTDDEKVFSITPEFILGTDDQVPNTTYSVAVDTAGLGEGTYDAYVEVAYNVVADSPLRSIKVVKSELVKLTVSANKISSLDFAIDAPVAGGVAPDSVEDGEGYTGAISWKVVNEGNSKEEHTGAFVAKKVYEATVELTAGANYKWASNISDVTVDGAVVSVTGVTGGDKPGNVLTFVATFPAAKNQFEAEADIANWDFGTAGVLLDGQNPKEVSFSDYQKGLSNATITITNIGYDQLNKVTAILSGDEGFEIVSVNGAKPSGDEINLPAASSEPGINELKIVVAAKKGLDSDVYAGTLTVTSTDAGVNTIEIPLTLSIGLDPIEVTVTYPLDAQDFGKITQGKYTNVGKAAPVVVKNNTENTVEDIKVTLKNGTYFELDPATINDLDLPAGKSNITLDDALNITVNIKNDLTYANSVEGVIKDTLVVDIGDVGDDIEIDLSVTIDNPETIAANSITVNYADKTLEGFEDGASYVAATSGVLPDAELDWLEIEPKKVGDTDVYAVDIDEAWFGKTVKIVKIGDEGTSTDSAPISVVIKSIPAAPVGVVAVLPTAKEGKGKLTGVSDAMQYRATPGVIPEVWVDVAEGEDEVELAPGTYQVRYKVDTEAFASKMVEVTIEKYGANVDTFATLGYIIGEDEEEVVNIVLEEDVYEYEVELPYGTATDGTITLVGILDEDSIAAGVDKDEKNNKVKWDEKTGIGTATIGVIPVIGVGKTYTVNFTVPTFTFTVEDADPDTGEVEFGTIQERDVASAAADDKKQITIKSTFKSDINATIEVDGTDKAAFALDHAIENVTLSQGVENDEHVIGIVSTITKRETAYGANLVVSFDLPGTTAEDKLVQGYKPVTIEVPLSVEVIANKPTPTLKELQISGPGLAKKGLMDEDGTFEDAVLNTTSSITLFPAATINNAVITVQGPGEEEFVANKASYALKLGVNTFKIKVHDVGADSTEPNPLAVKTYTLNLTRKGVNVELEEIKAEEPNPEAFADGGEVPAEPKLNPGDFGEIVAGTSAQQQVAVTSFYSAAISNATITIVGANPSAFVLDPESNALNSLTSGAKNDQFKVGVSDELTHTGGVNGVYTAKLRIAYAEPAGEGARPVVFVEKDLTVKIVQPEFAVTVTPDEADFEEAYKWQLAGKSQEFTIKNNGSKPLTEVAASLGKTAESAPFEISPATIATSIPAGGEVKFTVKPKTTLAIAQSAHTDVITIATKELDNITRNVSITVIEDTGDIAVDVGNGDNQFTVKANDAAQTLPATKTITVTPERYVGAITDVVASIADDAANKDLYEITNTPALTVGLTAAAKEKAVGDYNTTLTITYKDPNGATKTKTATVNLAAVTVPTGTFAVAGTVTAQGGGPLVGATVDLMQGGTIVKTATTVEAGAYSITEVPAGLEYTIRVTMAGYPTFTTPKFNVTAAVTGKTITVPVFTYVAEKDPEEIEFAEAVVGYKALTAKSAAIKNIGTGTLKVLTTTLVDDDATSFELTKRLTDVTIAPNATQTISVRPKTGLSAGIYTTKVVVTFEALDGVTNKTVPIPVTFEVTGLEKEETPEATVDYLTEEIKNLDAGARYTVNGVAYVASATGRIAFRSTWYTQSSLSIVKLGNGVTTTDSNAQTLGFRSRSEAPNVTAVDETKAGEDGQIINTTISMEYQKLGAATWTDVLGESVTGLEPGTYLVRIKAIEGYCFKGLEKTVTIKAYVISKDANLSALGYTVAGSDSINVPGFKADTLEYTINLPTATADDAAINLVAIKASSEAIAVVAPQNAKLEAGKGAMTVTVTAEDGTTTKVYKVNFAKNPKVTGVLTESGSADPVVKVATATVDLLQNGKVIKTVENPAEGAYTFSDLSSGSYTIRVTAAGYKIYEAPLTVGTENVTNDIALTKIAANTTTISIKDIPGVTAPVAGATQITAFEGNAQYSGTVKWTPTPTASKFAFATVYTATITLTPKAGFTLDGVAADFFAVAGATSVTNAKESGVVTAVFPATEKMKIDNYKNIILPVPTVGAIPVTSIVTDKNNKQYSATVAWTPVDGFFQPNLKYTATISINPIGNYTADGLAADFFTVNGEPATLTTGGKIAVEYTLGDATIDSMGIRGIVAPVVGAAPVKDKLDDTTQYTLGTVTWFDGAAEFTGANFEPAKAYTAKVDLAAKKDYQLPDGDVKFTVAGATVTFARAAEPNDKKQGTLSVTFPATKANTAITIKDIVGVAAPVGGRTPASTITATSQFTGAVAWNEVGSTEPLTGTFVAGKAYEAKITLTPRPGYGVQGVKANYFTVEGASAKSQANSNEIIATFPKAFTWTLTKANGTTLTETTTELTLAFDADPGLLAKDVSIIGASIDTFGPKTGAANTYTLKIKNILVADGRNVTVTLKNPAGSNILVPSKPVAVNVKTADNYPVIGTQPSSTPAYVDGTATFTVAGVAVPVGTAPTLTRQWQKLQGAKWADIAGATTDNLTLSRVQLTDAGSYRFVATNTVENNKFETFSNVVTLTVNQKLAAAPVIYWQPANTTVYLTDSYAGFQIYAYGDDLSYQWQMRPAGKTNDNTAWANIVDANLDYDDYVHGKVNYIDLSSVYMADSGNQYRCVVTNTVDYGSGDEVKSVKISNHATLTVINPYTYISLSEDDVKLAAGETYELGKKLSTYPNNKDEPTDDTILWSSNNKDVADVDQNGTVTAKKLGSATITARSANNSKYTSDALCVINVTPGAAAIEITPPQGYNVTDGRLTVSVGQLPLTLKADRDVTWKSSDAKVVAINAKGEVSYKGTGTATITATAKTGNPKPFATLILEVKDVMPKLDVSKLTVNAQSDTGTTFQVLGSDNLEIDYNSIRIAGAFNNKKVLLPAGVETKYLELTPAGSIGKDYEYSLSIPKQFLSQVKKGNVNLALEVKDKAGNILGLMTLAVNVTTDAPKPKVAFSKTPIDSFWNGQSIDFSVSGTNIIDIRNIELLSTGKPADGDVTKNFDLDYQNYGRNIELKDLNATTSFTDAKNTKLAVKGVLKIYWEGLTDAEASFVNVTIPIKPVVPKLTLTPKAHTINPAYGTKTTFEIAGVPYYSYVKSVAHAVDSQIAFEAVGHSQYSDSFSLDLINYTAGKKQTFNANLNVMLDGARAPIVIKPQVKTVTNDATYKLSATSVTFIPTLKNQTQTVRLIPSMTNMGSGEFTITAPANNQTGATVTQVGTDIVVSFNGGTAGKTDSYTIKPDGTTQSLTLKVVTAKANAKATVTVKPVTGSKIDLLQRENTSLIYTPTIKGTTSQILGVELVKANAAANANDYAKFDLNWFEGWEEIELMAKVDETYVKGATYKMQFKFLFGSYDENGEPVVDFEINTADISVKPVQSAVKHDDATALTMYQSRTTKGMYDQTISLASYVAKQYIWDINVADVQFAKNGNPNNAYGFKFNKDDQTITVWIADSSLVKIGNASLTFDVVYAGQGVEKSGALKDLPKPFAVKVPVTVLR